MNLKPRRLVALGGLRRGRSVDHNPPEDLRAQAKMLPEHASAQDRALHS
jgi:hypothetical protein